ncbi:hypothetical protein [Streptomyces sp. NPDC047315]|uniref:hypothetical protein n=1 Tax=Streptomyces sp. NPDC047315 TaxID=3155142 RepID=UPI0033E019B0
MIVLLLLAVVVLSLVDIVAIDRLPARPWASRGVLSRPALDTCSCGRLLPSSLSRCSDCPGGTR